jgi:serine/threonine-protein kinase RsbW
MNRFAKVRLELESHPESVALVRAALSGFGEWRGLDLELLNDVKTAVSEACNNVIVHAYDGAAGPLAVQIEDNRDGVTATVRDHGVGFQALASHGEGMGVGLAVISALAARAEFATPADGGTEVRMWFLGGPEQSRPLAHFNEPHDVPATAGAPVDDDRLSPAYELTGDVRVTVTPVSLTTPVLGRLARALAATARFSFDRFSDVYLVADAVGSHVQRTATQDRISFALAGSAKQVELSIGPFGAGTGTRLNGLRRSGEAPESPLRLLADDVRVDGDGRVETLHVVLRDRGDHVRARGHD